MFSLVLDVVWGTVFERWDAGDLVVSTVTMAEVLKRQNVESKRD